MSYWPFTTRRDTKKDDQITELEAQVTRLTEQNTKLAQESTERFETITQLRKDIAARDERIRELEADSMKFATETSNLTQENGRLSATIEALQARALPDDVLAFINTCARGVNIRTDKPGGTKLVEKAMTLLKQYDA